MDVVGPPVLVGSLIIPPLHQLLALGAFSAVRSGKSIDLPRLCNSGVFFGVQGGRRYLYRGGVGRGGERGEGGGEKKGDDGGRRKDRRVDEWTEGREADR